MSQAFTGLTDDELLEMLRVTEDAGFAEDREWCRTVRQELKRRWIKVDELRRRGESEDGT